MLAALLEWDQAAFEWLNGTLHHPWLDAIMPHWRNKTTWIPLYVLLVVWLYRKLGRHAIWVLLAVGLTVLIADQLSSAVIKPWIERPRPCWALAEMRSLIPCGGGYSFPSSHASNHFAIVVVLYGLLRLHGPAWGWALLGLWAASIAYGQVYVGVHYPLDVTAGALLGGLVGGLVAWGARRFTVYQTIYSPTL